MLQYLEVNPSGPPQASIIWLHGLGADGNDFLDIIPQLNLPEELKVRFVFPHAPKRSIEWADNMEMRAWFNVKKEFAIEDTNGIRESQQLIDGLVAAEMARNIPSNKIILAGFSQGGAMALQCGLRFVEPLGGILVLSAWLPLAGIVASERHSANQATPILFQHGQLDSLIPLDWAKKACNTLKKLRYNVGLDVYPMQHSVCADEIINIAHWLKEVL